MGLLGQIVLFVRQFSYVVMKSRSTLAVIRVLQSQRFRTTSPHTFTSPYSLRSSAIHPMPDTLHNAEAVFHRYCAYVAYLSISFWFLMIIVLLSLSLWTFLSVIFAVLILFKVYYDNIFVPYKPSSIVLLDLLPAAHAMFFFCFGFMLIHPVSLGSSKIFIDSEKANYTKNDNLDNLVHWIVLIELIMLLPFVSFDVLSSLERNAFGVKGLAFLAVSCTFSSMISSVFLMSMSIVGSWQTGFIFLMTTVTDVVAVLLVQLFLVVAASSSIFDIEVQLLSPFHIQTKKPFVEGIVFSTCFMLIFMYSRVAPISRYSDVSVDWQNMTVHGEKIRTGLAFYMLLCSSVLRLLFSFGFRIVALRFLHRHVMQLMNDSVRAFDSREGENGRTGADPVAG